MGILHFDIIEVELFNGTNAHVTGKWELKRDTDKGDLSCYFTLIVKKINKRWVIVSDHSS